MRRRDELAAASLDNGNGLVARFLDNGALFGLHAGDVMVNLVLGSPMGGALGNLFLRSFDGGAIAWTPLIGPRAPGRFAVGPDSARWAGTLARHRVRLLVRAGSTMTLPGRGAAGSPTVPGGHGASTWCSPRTSGSADESHVRTNELYTSQYIDHTVLRDPSLGYVVCSRQNLAQAGAHPWVAHACAGGATGYLTDAFQLYGTASRATGEPQALGHPRLASRRLQYEVAMPVLQGRRIRLRPGGIRGDRVRRRLSSRPSGGVRTCGPGVVAEAVGRLATSRAGVVERAPHPDGAGPLQGARNPIRASTPFDRPVLFPSRDLPQADIERLFGPPWRNEETPDGVRHSFFRGADEHVVLRAKELVQERPTGHLLRAARRRSPTTRR